MKWCVSFLLFEIAIGFCSKAELIQETISSHGDCKKPPKTHTHMQVCMHTCTHIITAQMCSSDVEIVSGCVLVFSLPFLHAHLYLVSGCVLVFSLPFLHPHLYLCNKTLQPPPQVTTKWRKQNKKMREKNGITVKLAVPVTRSLLMLITLEDLCVAQLMLIRITVHVLLYWTSDLKNPVLHY